MCARTIAAIALKVSAFIFLALGSVTLFTQTPSETPAILVWQDVAPRYKTFVEIKPVLINSGPNSIFLSRIWPHSAAQLERLSEETGNWESGSWSGGCGSVANATKPIEIKSHTERQIIVDWELSTDEGNKHFVAATSRAERPIPGTYRFVLRYSLEPWTLISHPRLIYEAISPEFVVGDP